MSEMESKQLARVGLRYTGLTLVLLLDSILPAPSLPSGFTLVILTLTGIGFAAPS